MKRSTQIMVVLFVLMGALTYYTSQPDNLITKAFAPTPTKTEEPRKQVIGIEKPAAILLGIRNSENRQIMITNLNGVWMVTDGYTDMASQEAAGAVIDGLRQLNVMSEIGTPTDLKQFGLEQPAYKVNIGYEDKTVQEFQIGNLTPTGLGYYVRMDDGNVVVVNKYSIETLTGVFNQPLFMFTATPSPLPTNTPTETPIPPTPTATAATTETTTEAVTATAATPDPATATTTLAPTETATQAEAVTATATP